MKKFKGYKKAVSEYNNWFRRNLGRAEIMLDTDTGEIWCDTFVGWQEWREYHSESIFTLFVPRYKKITMVDVLAEAEAAMVARETGNMYIDPDFR